MPSLKINTRRRPVFRDPARPLKVLYSPPEVDAEPQPKKLCVIPSDPGRKAKDLPVLMMYYCEYCEKMCHHMTALCPFFDLGYSDDEFDPRVGEYDGPKEGFSWTCLLGCIGMEDCSFDHGETDGLYGFTRGFYVRKLCHNCGQGGHWMDECSKPTFKFSWEEEGEGAAAADADGMGEVVDNTST